MNIEEVKDHLKLLGIDGWLIYHFQQVNPFASRLLSIEAIHLTRALFYFIPVNGEPIKLLHVIEEHALDHLLGVKKLYSTWKGIREQLLEMVKKNRKIAMEYSSSIPSISKVDGGTIDLIRSLGVEVVSSGSFLGHYTSTLSHKQVLSHLKAAAFLDETAKGAWKWISSCLKNGTPITDCDVQEWIMDRFSQENYVSQGSPICAVNADAADPHFSPKKERPIKIKKNDFILIDLWCKKSDIEAVYADITRVAVAASAPSSEEDLIFQIVRKAQKVTADFIADRLAKKKIVRGFEADQVCRQVISESGYGEYFIHRTGHNIYTQDHGPGANLDSLETFDERPLLPKSCFSIEPGIYLKGKFGVRLEHDVCILENGEVLITGGVQESIVTLL